MRKKDDEVRIDQEILVEDYAYTTEQLTENDQT